MQRDKTAWILKHFCPVALVGILCLGIGLFLGRMLLRQRTDTLAIEVGRSSIVELTPSPAPNGCLNLNTASVKELAELPGIGPVLAERIVEYRRTIGHFRYPYEITDISGIDEKIYTALRDRITAD
ncbi:MAG: helix-hairpin-helix domain-containing protein [Oscillospiraceae bacterium]|nr:helix-hairpin-helix domain-containing protein [Oscillospiraceae bacterium]